MSEPTEVQAEEVKDKPRRKFGKWVFVSIFLLILCALLLKPVRSQICDWTYICFYTCDTYTGKTWAANSILPWGTEITCEQNEINRNHAWYVWFDSPFQAKKKPQDTKGTVFTKDGVYEDGKLISGSKPETSQGEDNE